MDPLREFEEQGAFTDTERQRILYDSALGFYGFESGDLPTAPRSQPEGARSRADNPD